MTAATADTPAQSEPLTGRWSIEFRTYNWQQCRYCGHAGRDHNVVVCRACGTAQCQNETCLVCLVGVMPGFWSAGPKVCGYSRCGKEAAAKAPRVKYVCVDHLGRAKQRFAGHTKTIAGIVADALNSRVHGRRVPHLHDTRYIWIEHPTPQKPVWA